jgi:formylmethanofuran dehydrogenase subunit E
MNEAADNLLKRWQPYFEEGAKFHGWLSPGFVLGVIMVDLAKELLGDRDSIDAVVETKACIPDAVQLMTSCTYGNSWMRVKDWGRLALTLYDKNDFEGIRVYVDHEKITRYPVIEKWLMKTADPDKNEVTREIIRAERDTISWQKVKVAPYKKPKKAPPVVCKSCGESYPPGDSELCVRCSGKDDYYQT